MRLHIINDTSESMKVLGKESVQELCKRSISSLTVVEPHLSDLETEHLDWNSNPDQLKRLCEDNNISHAIILTDGYFPSIEYKKVMNWCEQTGIICRVVFCGQDAPAPSQPWEYRAIDIPRVVRSFAEVFYAE